MTDNEIKIFLAKIKKKPSLLPLLFVFFYKSLIDFLKRKYRKKRHLVAIPLEEALGKETLSMKPLTFILPYSDIKVPYKQHFSPLTETEENDSQYLYYTARFYNLLFIDKNNISEELETIKQYMAINSKKDSPIWHPYTVSERVINFCIFYSRFNSYLQKEEKDYLGRIIYEQSEFLFLNIEYNLGHHNHLLNNSRALLYASSLLAEEPFTQKWKNTAFGLIRSEIGHQVLPDGTHSEQSSTYHLLITRTFWEFRELYSLLNEPFHYEALLEKMVSYSVDLINYNNEIPLFGHLTPDFNWKELVGLASLWVNNSAVKPSAYSLLFRPNYCIENPALKICNVYMNSGTGIIKRDLISVYICNDPGCRIAAHGDQNMLGIDVFWGGTHLIRDCGLYSYDLNESRTWFESWQGQSTCAINKTNPIVIDWRRKQLPSHYYKAKATMEQISENAISAFHNCYSRLPVPVDINRKIQVKSFEVTIEDYLHSEGTNTYYSIFHFGSNHVELIDNKLDIIDLENNNHFVLELPGDLSIEFIKAPYATAYCEQLIGNSIIVSMKTTAREETIKYNIKKL